MVSNVTPTTFVSSFSKLGPKYPDPEQRTWRRRLKNKTKPDHITLGPITRNSYNGWLTTISGYPQSFIDLDKFIAAYHPMIYEHLDRRVNLFFQQTILCYQTQIYFTSHRALDQGMSAHPIFVEAYPEDYRELVSRHATHSSTIPCLTYRQNGKLRVYLARTFYYNAANITMNMPSWINNVDQAIDGIEDGLRKDALSILNRVSQEGLSPDIGLEEFIKKALERVQSVNYPFSDKQLKNSSNLDYLKDKQNYCKQKIVSIYLDYF